MKLRCVLLALGLTLVGSAASASDAAAAEVPTAGTTSTLTLHVEGIGCERCAARLRDDLRKLDGVLALEVNREKNEVSVTFDPERVSIERIKTEIAKHGFEVR